MRKRVIVPVCECCMYVCSCGVVRGRGGMDVLMSLYTVAGVADISASASLCLHVV